MFVGILVVICVPLFIVTVGESYSVPSEPINFTVAPVAKLVPVKIKSNPAVILSLLMFVLLTEVINGAISML